MNWLVEAVLIRRISVMEGFSRIDVPLGVRVSQGVGLLGSLIVDLREDAMGEGRVQSSPSVKNHGTADENVEAASASNQHTRRLEAHLLLIGYHRWVNSGYYPFRFAPPNVARRIQTLLVTVLRRPGVC